MLAFSVSGAKTFEELMACDALEVDRLTDYALTGPSEARTQMLIAQLIQLVSGIAGTQSPMGKLLPWFRELMMDADRNPERIDERRKRFLERQREAMASNLRK